MKSTLTLITVLLLTPLADADVRYS